MPPQLGDMLIEEGVLSSEQFERAVRLARDRNESLVRTLVRQGIVAEDQLLRVVARHQGLVFVVLREQRIDASAVAVLSARVVAHYKVMPVKLEGGVLSLAVSSPFDMAAVEDIESSTGLRVERALAAEADILDAIRTYYGVGAETVERILADYPVGSADVRPAEESHDLEHKADDASVIKLVNQLLHQAITDRATDIHFEVYRDEVMLRRRIDGVLYDTAVSRSLGLLYPAIVSRVKLMAGLNIVERRLPQDGRARVSIGHEQFDLRVSVVPGIHGENVVIRILPTTMLFSLEQLGLSAGHLEILTDLIRLPHGIVFVTGPTGSGKSTTLYACLSRLNTREHKIITIEDPVEYELKGILQSQVNPRIDLTFARALRSMLRHDPDIMMVGEVRDRETAEITIQTSLTGHLVFSTLHTNDAASAAIRLLDMGIDPYLISSTVRAFMAQRLVRVVCAPCQEWYEEKGRRCSRGRGCRQCNGTGYRGRVAISEIITLGPALQDLILRRASARAIREKAVALGMKTLAEDGWDKIAEGVTTVDEVTRVTFDTLSSVEAAESARM
jgi:type II secretory ATPase GspE/PulE/Tfp pilus assembly ATPase PilB-like protein